MSNDVELEEREQFYYKSKIIKEEGLMKDMQPLVLELDMARAKAAIKKRDAVIQRKNLKFASSLQKSGQLDGLTKEEAISIIIEEVEVGYDDALDLYDQLFQN